MSTTCVIRHDMCHDTKQSSLPQLYHSSIIIVTRSPFYRGTGYITQQCMCLHTSSPHAYLKAQSKWGSADNTAHLSDVTSHRLQTTWQIWWLCSSLFANSNPPVLVHTLYALCSKVSVTLGGINIVFVIMSGMMASCYFHSSTPHLSFQIKHWTLYVPSVCITECCWLVW